MKYLYFARNRNKNDCSTTEAHQEQQISSDATPLHLLLLVEMNSALINKTTHTERHKTIWHNIIQYLDDERQSSIMKIV